MGYDYSKLRGLIRERVGTEKNLADIAKLGRSTLSLKLSNKREFSTNDIAKISSVLNINNADIGEYFFTQKVEKYKHNEC